VLQTCRAGDGGGEHVGGGKSGRDGIWRRDLAARGRKDATIVQRRNHGDRAIDFFFFFFVLGLLSTGAGPHI
jgi:hypothetical protein